MNEVSCRVFDLLFFGLKQRGIADECMVEGMSVSLAKLRSKKESIDWDDFLKIMRNIRPHFTDAQFVELGRAYMRQPGLRFASVIARQLFSTMDFYRWMNKPKSGVGNQMFTCIQPTHRELSATCIEVDLTLSPGYEVCWEFFVITIGNLEEMPRLLGQPRATVTFSRMHNGGRFHVVFTEGGSLLTRIRRGVTWPVTFRSAARELKEAHETLQERFNEIESARARLAQQARQLTAANQIAELALGNLSAIEAMRGVCVALVEHADCALATLTPTDGAEVQAGAESDPNATHHRQTHQLTSGELALGQLTVVAPSAEIAATVDSLVPTIALVVQKALAEERIRFLAQHDPLTGLPNRVVFRDRVIQAIAQARRNRNQIAVLFIDLDRFKHINDSLGHQTGDLLLQVAAVRLVGCLRQGDTVARLGGDEFVISLSGLENNNATMLVAGHVLEALRRPFVVGGHELHVSCSIGISVYPNDGSDADALLRAADTAMYHAKEKGRNNYQFFTQRLNEVAQRRLSIANRLHQALQREEFILHYQPQINLESGEIFAAEALVRWQPADGAMILPGEFIGIAEETGLIVPLGAWVLREACAQLERWHQAGYTGLRVAVNLSPQQFHRPGFAELAARLLEESGLLAESLELEITESVLMARSEENMATLENLANMGVGLAIDDFGTGYSSLSYLQRFPIHSLKIDQSFVAGISSDVNDTAIVTAIIAMAQSLRLNVVAEGVETAEQVAFLKHHGCLAAQGFYFSRGVPAEDFIALLKGRAEAALSTT